AMIELTLDGKKQQVADGSRLIDVINRARRPLAQVCYHQQMGPIQTCDTCMVEVDGKLVRACGTVAAAGTSVSTSTPAAANAQREASARILTNHVLFCTVCDNNNGNGGVHNPTKLLGIDHQALPFRAKPYSEDHTNP